MLGSISTLAGTLARAYSLPDAGHWDRLCRFREFDSHTIAENHWLELVRHAFVHDWTVAVPVDIRLPTLLRTAPTDAAHFPARNVPPAVPVEGVPESFHDRRTQEIHESVAQASLGIEIHGQV